MSFPAEGLARYIDLFTDSLDRNNYSEIIDSLQECDLTRAERLCLQKLDQSRNDAISWSLLGLTYLISVDAESAGEAILKASKLAPESCLTLNLLGEFLCCSGKHDLGEAALRQSLDRNPNQEFPLRMLLHQYVLRRDFEKVVEVLFPLVRLCPDDEVSWRDLRDLLSRLKVTHKYEVEIEQLTRQFPDKYLAWDMHALRLLEQKRVDEAEAASKTALSLYRNDDKTWHLYGSILSIAGRHKAAVKAQRKSLLLNRESPDAWLSLSVALIKCGKRSQAKKAIDKLIALDPDRAIGIAKQMMKIWGGKA